MRCAEFDELNAAYVSGELDTRRQQAFEEHLATCAACASLLQEQLRVDTLLRASLTSSVVRTSAVKNRVRAAMAVVPWWRRLVETRSVQVAFACVLILMAAVSIGRLRFDRSAADLLQTAAADHVEDVVQRLEKDGWVRDPSDAERLAVRVVGDARPLRALAASGYVLVKARPCQLEGKAETWLHLIYRQGAREVSLFVRSSRVAPESKGQLALAGTPARDQVGDLEVVGLRQGDYGLVFVGAVSSPEAVRIAAAAARWVS